MTSWEARLTDGPLQAVAMMVPADPDGLAPARLYLPSALNKVLGLAVSRTLLPEPTEETVTYNLVSTDAARNIARYSIGTDAPESITCPVCDGESHHPEDIRNRYCPHCRQFHDIMLQAAELAERPTSYLAGDPVSEPQRSTPADRVPVVERAVAEFVDVTIGVDDSRFRSVIYQALQERALSSAPPPAHYYVDVDGQVFDLRDQVTAWERSLHQSLQAWRAVVEAEAISRHRFSAYVGELRDELGQAVPERDPAPCGWHHRGGFRFGGAATDLEPMPVDARGLL